MSSFQTQDFSEEIELSEDDGFSEELRNIISEMGYNVEDDELREIEKDLRLIEENADISDTRLFSCLLGGFNGSADLDQSLFHLSSVIASPGPKKQNSSDKLPKEFDELLDYGYERLNEVYDDIKKYEQLMEESERNVGETIKKGSEETKNREDVPEQESISSSLKKRDKDFGKENKRPVTSRKGNFDPKVENRLINQFLRENALRPTQYPEPGRLPFKHDHRLKLEQYRTEWAKMPPPGEQKRMALRWRVRELMLRRDIPHLCLVKKNQDNQEIIIILLRIEMNKHIEKRKSNGLPYTTTNITNQSVQLEKHGSDEKEVPFSFLAMMGRSNHANNIEEKVKEENKNISLYKGNQNGSKFFPVFFVDKNTDYVNNSLKLFCKQTSKDELFASFNKSRGTIINFYKNEKKSAIKNQKIRKQEEQQTDEKKS
ncbi:HYLS1_C domain-containing protein [Meloidogyne graminicola]|uniref:HYLS1_C domain-containing protein n=1 Tax=Meloidogyne graminicola TaxID=189291 RepID=A0A8S9ZSC2_9BILA|nr:HYLS1_C domain-containing protein [Meloidogyne graminicola]